MPASPASSRLRRSPLFDVRLIIGIALVAASVLGVLGIVSSVDQRATVYAAASSLSPGDRIRLDDLIPRQVALDGAEQLYLTTEDVPAGGLIAGTVVRRGELVPRSAVGSAEGRRSTTLVIAMTGRVSAAVVPGARVDIWSAPTSTAGVGTSAFGPPIVLTSDAVVVRVLETGGIVASADGESVELLVPRNRVARLLQAIANGDSLAIVPAGIPLDER